MQQTDNYNLNKFETDDELETASRLALNQNADIIDAALKDASENGGIAVSDTQPQTGVLAWVDSDALGADFCFVGDTAPAADGTVAVWVDTSEDEIPVQSGAGGVSYDNTESGLTADDVQGAIDEITADFIIEQGTDSIWTYRKWNSGIAECWGFKSETAAITRQEGALYFANAITYNFPTGLFIETPNVLAIGQVPGKLGNLSLHTVTDAAISFYFWCSVSGSATVNGRVYAIGKWK